MPDDLNPEEFIDEVGPLPDWLDSENPSNYYSRAKLNDWKNISLTDNQWRIVKAEVVGSDYDEELWEIIEDVVDNIDDYEKEYEWWENEGWRTNKE